MHKIDGFNAEDIYTWMKREEVSAHNKIRNPQGQLKFIKPECKGFYENRLALQNTLGEEGIGSNNLKKFVFCI